MALGALLAESAMVRIVGAVAAVTARVELGGACGHPVAGCAGKALMLAIKGKTGLARMIEPPSIPAARDMALRTVGRLAQTALVKVIGMAGGTGQPLGGKAAIDVTPDAGRPRVLPEQGEPRQPMVEAQRLAPPCFVMATRAIGTETPAMRVVGAMATDAGGGRLDRMQRSDVARGADDATMRAFQGQSGHPVVIEMDGLPLGGGMAGCAIGAKLTVMHILVRMAGDAGRRWMPLGHVLAVTAHTAGRCVGTDQGEARVAIMVERGELPSRRRVARGAIAAAGTVVDVVAAVTGDASSRRSGQPPVTVAPGAGRPAMQADKGIAGSRVIERVDRLPRS